MNRLPQRIIDCHIHPVVDGETDFNRFRSSGKPQKQIDDLRRAGITQACGAPVSRKKPETFADIRRLNDQCLA
ncbi:MAG: hypothetical protein PHV34_08110 [Verrucomicrobiae bacterium]|nr:hypothetical protein [Verrucomicrobiae bacterium]